MPRLSALLLTLVLALGACTSTEVVTAPPATTPAATEPVADGTPPAAQPAEMQSAPVLMDPDTVRAGRFDNGRMFTFDNPPRAYLTETYGFSPDDAWFAHARLGALRFATYCSASFVSPNGLILTNHHCARESVTEVTRDGEQLHDSGFYASTTEAERRAESLFVEQLTAITDVTAEVEAALVGMETDAERINARDEAIAAMEERMTTEAGGEDAGMRVQVIAFYNGAQHAAYTFRRYDDVRLAFAPEAQLGSFGGDQDNFTYPRYSLDFSLFRAYGDDGKPLDTEDVYFPWSADGTEPGDLVFVIGNPGSTERLQTIAELEYRRDVSDPAVLRLYTTRADAYKRFVDANPNDPATPEIEDTFLSLANARKAYGGIVEGLRDPYVIARRGAAERTFRDAVTNDATLRTEYGTLFDAITANREDARAFAADYGAFAGVRPGGAAASNILTRALYAYAYAVSQRENFREVVLGIEDRPVGLEQNLLEARLADFVFYYGADSDLVRSLLQGRTPTEAARDLVENSAFATAEGAAEALGGDLAAAGDPALALAALLWPRYVPYQQQSGMLSAQLDELTGRLGRARFDVFGTDIPPDATFSLRLNDGVVQGYDYNGTVAPPYTTFYGLYDRHFAFEEDDPNATSFTLPERWLPIPADLDLDTPYNFVTTNDIIGGNSGSPMLNRDLEIVGIAFDGNIESLPGDYIYLPNQNRCVGVDSRGMLEVLRSVYDADRLAEELVSGELVVR